MPCKTIVKKIVPQTRTFTPVYQMKNYVPIPGMPQAYHLTSHPTIPVQHQYPFVQHNPLVNLLQDISGRNRTVQADR